MARIYGARVASRAYRDRARARRRAVLRGCLKWLLYAVCALLLCVAEGTVFSTHGTSISDAAPFLLPAWITVIAMLEGYVGGAWFGLAAGLLSSAAGGDAVYLLPPFYMLYGLCVGMLGARFLKKGFFIYAAYETAVCAVHGVVRLCAAVISAMLADGAFMSVLPLVWTKTLGDVIASAVPALFFYLPAHLIHRLTAEHKHDRDTL